MCYGLFVKSEDFFLNLALVEGRFITSKREAY